jgi:CheY-like chemotaxis protein
MSKPKVKVLLLEDEPSMMKLLLHFFKTSSQIDYLVTEATGLSDCVRLAESLEAGFDVWILDLTLADCGGAMPAGFLPLLCRMMGPPPASTAYLRVIYTASQRPEDQAMALKSNATHFVSKAEVLPHQLVSHVTDEILLQLRRARQAEVVADFFSENFADLVQTHGGKHIVISFEAETPTVVGAAPTRVEALVNWYRDQSSRPKSQEVSAAQTLESLPFVLYVPKNGV